MVPVVSNRPLLRWLTNGEIDTKSRKLGPPRAKKRTSKIVVCMAKKNNRSPNVTAPLQAPPVQLSAKRGCALPLLKGGK